MKMIFNLSHIFKLLNTTFFNTEKEYFNRTALKQLQQAAYSLSQKEYFTCRNVQNRINCIKNWFSFNLKSRELDLDGKIIFRENNVITSENLCCLYHFPLNPRLENSWANHVFKAEHLFLEKIYTEKQMKKMGIDNFEVYSEKLNKLLDSIEEFCDSLENTDLVDLKEVEEIISKIKKIKLSAKCDEKTSREKTILFLYNHSIPFLKIDKITGDVTISNKFLSNIIAIFENEITIHLSRVIGKIIGYAHDFRNQKVKENFYTIPVFAHNQFRFDFFLLLKGLRPTVWRTQEIHIDGKNPSNVNFAIIKNQVTFIDTVKYFQQNLPSLAKSMTDDERENVKRTCRNFIAKKLILLTEENEKCIRLSMFRKRSNSISDCQNIRFFRNETRKR